MKLARWISQYYFSSLGEALALFISFKHEPILKLTKKEIEMEKQMVQKSASLNFQSIRLTLQQQQATATFKKYLTSFHCLYLKGVTASGKTYVYLELARIILKQEKQVLVLVPEISLTWKMGSKFSEFLQDENSVALYHSHFSPRKRLVLRKLLREGKIKVLVGTRSALFLQFKNLGLIVVDEEHDHAYKNNSTPRYHLAQCAQYFAAEANIPLLFGSATPSINFFFHKKKGLVWQELTDTYTGVALPQVHIVEQPLAMQNIDTGGLKSILLKRIFKTLERKKQIIVYLNRRGFSRMLFCDTCNYFPTCPNCDISLVYHKQKNILLCHYCSYNQGFFSNCPVCKVEKLEFINFGVEKVFEYLKRTFSSYTIERFDSDTLTTSKKMVKTLNAFQKGEIAMLVGTSMIGKGHDFPDVDLVVVVHPERTLLLPDFRSNERLFQELTQVIGRAGRRNAGEVWIQTGVKTHSVFQKILTGTQDQFYLEELEYRKRFSYPPFYRICRLVFRSKIEKKARESAFKVKEKLATILPSASADFMGPSPCFFSRQATYFRWQIVFKVIDLKPFLFNLTKLKTYFHIFSQVYIEVDMDPADIF